MTEAEANSTRLTIDRLNGGLFAPPEELARVADRGRRRHRTLFPDFDTRATVLAIEIQEQWEERTKAMWRENKARTVNELRGMFGEFQIERKVQDFTAMGEKPFSIIAYHNILFEQVRFAFVAGAYYPALVGACALGERILNHLVLDLREDFPKTRHYKRAKRAPLRDWQVAIDILAAWDVLLPDVIKEFRELESLRHRSVHFNPDTYFNLRDDALTAIAHLRVIIDRQFGTFGTQPWFISGTHGAAFIKREYEKRPFIRRYYLPQCPCVGVLIGFDENLRPLDFHDYGDDALTDEEFCASYNSRDPASVAGSKTVAAAT
jgi:hypothetical protein